MTGWVAIAAIGLLAIGAGALLLRAQPGLWTLLAAVVVFGLAGYAWQGSPGYPSAPAQAGGEGMRGNTALVDARREFFSESNVPSNFVTVADAFARRGDFGSAARLLQGVVVKDPEDGEAWLALGIALVEHAGGQATGPAEYALAQAREQLPGNPGPAFFEGVNALRIGDLPAAREIWGRGIVEADPQAEGREYMAERILALDGLMEAVAGQQAAQGPARAGPPSE